MMLATRRASEIEPQEIEFVWPDRIPEGKVTLFVGEPCIGKSLAALSVATTVTTGGRWPDSDQRAEVGHVAILAAEDDAADTIIPRLLTFGADLDRVTIIDGTFWEDKPEDLESFMFTRHVDALYELDDVKLLIIDTLSHFLTGDLNKHGDAKQALRPLVNWCANVGAAVIGIEHLGKDRSKSPLARVLGSTAIAGQARAVWGFAADADRPGRTLMLKLKMNLAADVGGLAFDLMSGDGQHPTLAWSPDPVTIDPGEAFSPPKAEQHSPRLTEAIEWLTDRLADGEDHYAKAVYGDGEAAGFSDKLLRSALKSIGSRPFKDDFSGRWKWRLPKADAGSPCTSALASSSVFGHLRETENPKTDEDGRRRTTNRTRKVKSVFEGIGHCLHPPDQYERQQVDGRTRITCGACQKFVGYDESTHERK
jgi:putative DNA primase/helicase